MNLNNKKSHFEGYQAKPWSEILKHSLFTEIGEDLAREHNYTWLLSIVDKNKLNEAK